MKTLAALFSIGAILFFASCTEPVGPPPPPRLEPTITSVKVAPPMMEIIVNGCQKFQAEVKGTNGFDTTVTWTLEGMGTLSADGQYCAPASEGTALIVVRSTVDTTKTDTAYVTVRYGIVAVAVSPESAELDFGETLQFTATVSGTNQNASGTWSAQYGTITSSGRYTAPNFTAEDKVVFTSSVDPTKSDTAYVAVTKAEWIAFTNFDAFVSRTGHDIYVVRTDGKKYARLTTSPYNDLGPAWSPDGSRIAFSRDGLPDGAHNGIRVVIIDANGGNEQIVGPDSIITFQPSWSPDGTKLVVIFIGNGRGGVATMNSDGSNLTDLYSVPCSGGFCSIPGFPDWSPDGSRIAFNNMDGGIYVMDAGDGANLHPIISAGGYPKWSPDGTKILFISADGISVANADGSNTQLLLPTTEGSDPDWSPDGTKIVYVGNYDEPAHSYRAIYVMNSDGTDKRLVRGNHSKYGSPAWKP